MCKTSTITLETIPVKIVKIEKIISTLNNSCPVNGDPFLTERKRQIICWIENHLKKIDNYIEN